MSSKVNFLGGIIFQHDYDFILNKIVRAWFGDWATHTALITESTTELKADTVILNTVPKNHLLDVRTIEHELGLLMGDRSEFEVWLPKEVSKEEIYQALEKAMSETIDKPYAYFQLVTYVLYYYGEKIFSGMRNPYTEGVWCGEYIDVYLSALGRDPDTTKSKDEIRPEELREYVMNSGLFYLAARKEINGVILYL
jgi:hypothetical protein